MYRNFQIYLQLFFLVILVIESIFRVSIYVVFGARLGPVQTHEISTLQVEAFAFHDKYYIGNCDRLVFDGKTRQTKHIFSDQVKQNTNKRYA